MAEVFLLPNGAQLMLDYDGIGEVLRSADMQGVMAEFANALAAELGGRGVERVWVDTYTTDRGAASVTIPDYSGDDELKWGLLADAATAIGLEVKRTANDD